MSSNQLMSWRLLGASDFVKEHIYNLLSSTTRFFFKENNSIYNDCWFIHVIKRKRIQQRARASNKEEEQEKKEKKNKGNLRETTGEREREREG